MRRLLILLSSVSTISIGSAGPLLAQKPHFGVLVGRSLVGGGNSRMFVGPGVTGASQAGIHLRGFVDLPLDQSPFSFRAELFYNRLTSGSSTFDAGVNAKAALVDRSLGLTGSFIGTTSRAAAIAPYFSLGAGLFTTELGHNPDESSSVVTETYSGMGFGLTAGAGLRFRLGRAEVLLDWRYYQALYNTRGSSFMPLSIGLAF
jgi:hypothetical protein